ncbi:regulator of G-protein signaling 12-like [Salvelinus fontinalis]|uniref:regulator of G-protein signaling 12-like n=1 Tax=Salvelinus fontinalis TaxID=8038 RepID=UPI002484FB1A|nr:regulator of G-protein signaling 12-like [Salvelinus fontinalis]XP_055756541.1 regulator of G-protein signaling 12-like [Salvelinus fontinalis]XP_055756542.1 regulator of G-protein signaling 12-like [Salvelinus fontinalis]XP_055756543.1 regulator of G-protein signaling 12-like [Salvelinus fontinalis]XP_055756544.1 regulator of G-protein signaling 12-like [Salvelinus fontinalis]XP_055756545.1 regulator of G-protein signaling 12-like [Salvelinus fontinalis]XP_055756546.1 regulator of G-prote
MATFRMRMPGQNDRARRRLNLTSPQEVRGVEVVRGRVGYGFTLSGQGPCLLSGILEGSPADLLGLKQGDCIVSVNGIDVAKASHEAVVQLIGTCKGPLRLVVLVGTGSTADPSSSKEELGLSRTEGKGLFQKGGVFRAVLDHSGNSSCNSVNATPFKPRPLSEPDMSHWTQPWNSKFQPGFLSEEETAKVADVDSVFNDQENDVNPDWRMLNTAMVVGYLGSTELILALSSPSSEDDCLQVIRRCIRRMGIEQKTHTLVMIKIMFDCVRLCDDAGAVLAAFPSENLVVGVVCSEDRRFFCLVTTAHVSGGHVGKNGPLRSSCHVFFIDPELCHHSDHLGIAGRFGFDCTPDTQGCQEFPLTPPSVLQFVSVLYCDMGEAVERLRTRLDRESAHHLHTQQNSSRACKNGSASSNRDSGIGNASPPEERPDRDFPVAHGTNPGGNLPSCPWEDYHQAEANLTQIVAHQNGCLNLNGHPNPGSTHSLSESLPGPASLTGPSGGPPPKLEFQFKPPPPPYPVGKIQNLTEGGGPFRSSQRWFSMSVKQRWPRGHSGEPEPQATPATNSWSGPATVGCTNTLPPPMSQIPPERYQAAEAMMLLPQREEWAKRLWRAESGELLNGKPRRDANTKGSKFWGIGARRSSSRRFSGRRSFGHPKKLSLARSLDDLESTASSDADYGGGVQLQGCCSQSSLNSNSSLPGAGSHKRLSERRVASWAACFERLLQDPIGVCYFSEFLKKEFSEENILFWQACEYFSQVPATDKKQLSQRAGEIYNSFLSSKATTPVNIDSQAQLADDVLTSPCPNMFKAQQLQIFNLMKFDSYSRFLKSGLYQECMLAEVEGRPLPDPYQIPCSPAPSKHSASSGHSTPNKEARNQKSGRSLNEEPGDEHDEHKKRGIFFSWSRNRSFGKGPKKKDIGEINIDSWGSNGRRESQGSLSSGASLELATSCSTSKTEGDNRHSVPVWERVRECSKICSMTLPDGSCSSVTLRPGATIREVLRDLCQSLRINMAAVDLFLVGGEKPLVLDQDCMTLSARDLRMEKRTLFRLDLVPINRSVGLKAKPTKPVTEVLRPVVAKYGLHLKDLVAKISGETEPLDLGAPISSLDGLRVVLERADPVASGKDSKSKSGSLKAHLPSLTTKSLSATGDDRSSGKASGPDPSLPAEKRKPKKINIDEAEEFFELLSRAQSNRRNDQRGLLNKEDLELPDFLRLTSGSPSTASLDMACSTPTSVKQGQGPGRENGVGGAPARGPLNASLRSESLDSSLSSNGHSHSAAGRRALLPPPRRPVPPFSAALSPIPCPSESRGPALRTLEEDTHADLTLVGEGDITSPNSTLLAPALLSHEGSLPEGNFIPPSPCAHSFHDGGGNGQSSSERRQRACALDRSHKRSPCLGALRSQTALQEVMDVEGVCLEEEEEKVREVNITHGEDSELSVSFQGYAAELRQCQSRMKTSQVPLNTHDQSEGNKDSKTDIYKATIV